MLRLAAVVAVALALAGDALACSCLEPDLERDLPRADGAMVGTLTERRSATQLVFDVERVVKGAIGPTVVVHTAPNGAQCGLEPRQGERVGLLLTVTGTEWSGSLCGQVDPAALLAAATGYAPIGSGEDTPWTAWVGSAIVGIALFGLALWLGMRRRR